jgi:D-serine deaminase-like pyridoxal phosphate-dependent protein/predicted dehydrogenase
MVLTKAKRLRVALAGAGMISWYHLVAWRNLGERVRLVAICDPDQDRAEQRAREFSIPNVYADAESMVSAEAIDALDVASPRETHATLVETASARGIDVLCQKPMTPNLLESQMLARRVEGRSRLMVHENWRFRPWYRELKQWIDAGDLGDVLLARMAMITSGMLPDATGRRPSFERQPFMQHEERMMIAEVLIHHLDVMRFLCGELRVVAARAARTVLDVRGETLASIFLETAACAPIEVTGTMAAPGYPARPPDRLEIVGSRASAVFEDSALHLLGAVPRSRSYDRDRGYQASFDAVVAHFIDCLDTGAPFETGPADNLATLRLVEDAYTAAGLDGGRSDVKELVVAHIQTASSNVRIGQPKALLDTPALIVDLDILESNVANIARICRENNVGWRPHAKAHKTPEIARMQLAAGAIGITCAKVGEAEVMAAAGIRNILIANQVVGEQKVRRLIDLVGPADPIVAVDSIPNLDELSGAAMARGKELKVVIEIDVGMKRAGVAPGTPVVALAREIARRPGLKFAGVVAWESHATRIADAVEKERMIVEAIARVTGSARACRDAGFAVQIVSCGGTGTFPHCARQAGVTEVQVGGAIFSDIHYRTHYHVYFPFALTVLATVTSRPTLTRIVLDAGKKTMSGDTAIPEPIGLPPTKAMKLSAEHTTIELELPSETPRIGDRVEFVVGYSDTTVHLHDEMIGVRRGQVEVVWRIAGRGKIR